LLAEAHEVDDVTAHLAAKTDEPLRFDIHKEAWSVVLAKWACKKPAMGTRALQVQTGALHNV
jgi:hypothetical protein